MGLSFSETSIRIQRLLQPHHNFPSIPTILVLDWVNAGADPETQILPIIEENIARKLAAGMPVPTNLKYYNPIILAAIKKKHPVPSAPDDASRAKAIAYKLRKLKMFVPSASEDFLNHYENEHGRISV